MKIRSVLTILIILLTAGPAVFGQEREGEQKSTLLAETVYIQRVYPHSQGYKVVYNRSDLYPGEVYLPGRWFTQASGKGSIMYNSNQSVPYMTVFYSDGVFSHVRLFVHSNPSHPTWGTLPGGKDLSQEFAVETLDIVY
ncbi:MAG: hypothetical protein WCY01_06810 [Alkalispirochaeta sp.]|jgi:hypothetical protein